MVFPEDFDYERRQAREQRKEWLDISEEEQIAEGDISVSETVTGHNPRPEVFDDDFEDELDDEGMHVLDEAELETLEDPFDADGYLADEEDDEDDFDAEDDDFDGAEDWADEGLEDAEDTY